MSVFASSGTGSAGSPGPDPRKRAATTGAAADAEVVHTDLQQQIEALRPELLSEVTKTSTAMQGSLNGPSSK
eukprot:3319654-Pyramimonas_sp.AAC.1